MPTIFRDLVDINGFKFNSGIAVNGAQYNCDVMDGWADSGEPRVEISEFGYSDGVSAASRFPLSEKYVEFGGYVLTDDRLAAEKAMDRLSDVFGPNGDLLVTRYGPISKSMDMRASSALEFPEDIGVEGFRFIVRLMAEWPFKFSPLEKVAIAGVFSGGEYYRIYSAETNGRSYDPALYGRVYFPDVNGSSVVSTESRRNLVSNPFSGINTTYHIVSPGTGGAAAITRVATGGPSGGSFARATWSVATTAVGNAGITYGSGGSDPGVVLLPGDYLSGRVMARSSVAQRITVFVQYLNSAGNMVASNSTVIVLAANVWTAIAVDAVVVAPALAAKAHIIVFNSVGTSGVNWAIGDTLDVAQVQATKEPTAGTYFDGNTAPINGTPSKRYGWTGVPKASPSIETTLSIVSSASGLLDNATINNEGTADAYPVITITGPLLTGSWELVNETTGDVQSFEIDLSNGVDLVIDNREKTAFIGSQAVDYYLRGDWIRLIPGDNILRLSTGEANPNARLRVSARDTWKR